MTVSLQKGQKVDLSKSGSNITKLTVGLGWDASTAGPNIDCDASAIMLDENSKLIKDGVIYFGNKKSKCNSIIHSGDNLTGAGEGDDEQIAVDLSKVPQTVHRIVFVVNIYNCESRKQDFGMIKNAFIRVVDDTSRQELCKFNLTDNYAGFTTLLTGEIYRRGADWKFNALGEGTTSKTIKETSSRYL